MRPQMWEELHVMTLTGEAKEFAFALLKICVLVLACACIGRASIWVAATAWRICTGQTDVLEYVTGCVRWCSTTCGEGCEACDRSCRVAAAAAQEERERLANEITEAEAQAEASRERVAYINHQIAIETKKLNDINKLRQRELSSPALPQPSASTDHNPPPYSAGSL